MLDHQLSMGSFIFISGIKYLYWGGHWISVEDIYIKLRTTCAFSPYSILIFSFKFFSFWDLKPWKKCIILVSISHLQWHVYRLILKLQFAFWKMTFKLNIEISFKDFVKHFTPTHRTICKALKSMHLTKLISQLWSKNVFYHIFNIHLQMTYYRLHIYSNKTLFY